VNLSTTLYLLQSVTLLKLGVRIVETVLMVLCCYFSEVLWFCAIDLHVLQSCISEHGRGEGSATFCWWVELVSPDHKFIKGVGSIGVFHHKRSSFHLLKT